MTKITRRQLASIVDDYHRLLPDWHRAGVEKLVRADGPVLQAIGWEILRSGEYRPMNYVQVLAAPEPGNGGRVDFFAQHTKAWPGTLSLSAHSEFIHRLFESMKREFQPRLSESLRAENALAQCEHVAIPTSTQAYALAALNAYLGHSDPAKQWCSRFNSLVDALGQPWQSWHFQQRQFLDQLESWLQNGEAKRCLEVIVVSERSKFGL